MSSPLYTPATEAEAQDWIRQAHDRAALWLPVGSTSRCTRLQSLSHPLISSAAWQQIHWIDAEDRTCEVDAGLPLASLTAALAEHGLMLGHHAQSGTVGGLLNSGEPSLLAGSCGLPRDQVLGATWLLPDGRRIRSGARVVKSVAGYDVTRLLLSAQGQLAMCTRLILRLRPLPKDLRWYCLPVDMHRPAASWKPWCDFSLDQQRYAAWDGCAAPLQDAVKINEVDGHGTQLAFVPWISAIERADAAVQWIATTAPWSPHQMQADGKDLNACLVVDQLNLQSAWSHKQTMASLPEGSAVLPHASQSLWLNKMRDALIQPA
jgi:FAD/FMN-containing dehydrogenase